MFSLIVALPSRIAKGKARNDSSLTLARTFCVFLSLTLQWVLFREAFESRRNSDWIPD